MKRPFAYLLYAYLLPCAVAQAPDWQQRVNYVMQVALDTETHILQGRQQLTYYNNSPDTLRRVYYHLYFNAFQPGSMMDARSRSIEDPDSRVRDRILHLQANETGYQRVRSLKQAGQPLTPREEGTLLVVDLQDPLLPGKSTLLEMEFEARVPIQIRRSGRNSKENIAYSMSQWYPKLAEYDHRGWHATPYVGREFHGVWGDYDVTISLPAAYTVAATGLLQNPQKIGKGYSEAVPEGKQLHWHFVTKQVHDFVWAADTEYVHEAMQLPDGLTLRFFYKKAYQSTWQKMQPYAAQAFSFLSKHYGRYPYSQYSIIQGGDGGMEYPMATLVTGDRSLQSLVNVIVHEAAHSWYQGLLATNETLYAWMDEGFTTYATTMTMQHIFSPKEEYPMRRAYESYRLFLSSGKEEPMNTIADHFQTNRAYNIASYTKGAIFQHQLAYVVGQEAFDRGLLRYFDTWKYRHPGPLDYLRIMEKEAHMTLDWYYAYFGQTTQTIDYAIHQVMASPSGGTRITLAREGNMPMPIDLHLTLRDGSQRLYYIPLRIMCGEKTKESDMPRLLMSDWPWTHPYYAFDIPESLDQIDHLEIDPSKRMADIELSNNIYPFPVETGAARPVAPANISAQGRLLRQD